MTGRAYIGMAGWVYPDWRGTFYPAGLIQKRELEYASTHVTSIELNGSFYSLQKPASWRNWSAATPDDFVFSGEGPHGSSPTSASSTTCTSPSRTSSRRASSPSVRSSGR